MKNNTFKVCVAAALLTVFLMSSMPGEQVISKEGNATVVNTKTIGQDIKGYAGPTPVKIYIEKNEVTKIEVLPHQEGPKYMARAKKLLENYEGKTVSKAKKLKVDAVTGATFTSDALIRNVKKGLEYYEKNK